MPRPECLPEGSRITAAGARNPGLPGPHFTTVPPGEVRAGEEYVYQAKAFNAAVSGFTWFLETAPPGMTIDRYTGRVAWTPGEAGTVEVTVGASTVHGRMSSQRWTIRVRRAAARAPEPNRRFRDALRRRAEAVRAARSITLPPLVAWRLPKNWREEWVSRGEEPLERRPRSPPPLRR